MERLFLSALIKKFSLAECNIDSTFLFSLFVSEIDSRAKERKQNRRNEEDERLKKIKQ
jgi:hypothetical protein